MDAPPPPRNNKKLKKEIRLAELEKLLSVDLSSGSNILWAQQGALDIPREARRQC